MKNGAHVLIGIVSKRLGSTCGEQDLSIYTSVSFLMSWIEAKIKENGGMASCDLSFKDQPSLGGYHNKKLK